MAKAFKCDICGNYYDAYNTRQSAMHFSGFIPINVDSEGKYFTNNAKHVCPKCMNAMLDLFIKLGRKNTGELVEYTYEVNVGSGCGTGSVFVPESATDDEIYLAIMHDLYDVSYEKVKQEAKDDEG